MAQKATSQSDRTNIAFDSRRLNEACKTRGVFELHLVQREARILKTQYQASVTLDEMTQRQMQHDQFASLGCCPDGQ